MNKGEIEKRLIVLREHYVLLSCLNGRCNYEETRELFDYIEHLQKENEELKQLNNGIREERDYLINKKSFENKQLHIKINKIMQIIELNQYNYGYQIKEEILKGEDTND